MLISTCAAQLLRCATGSFRALKCAECINQQCGAALNSTFLVAAFQRKIHGMVQEESAVTGNCFVLVRSEPEPLCLNGVHGWKFLHGCLDQTCMQWLHRIQQTFVAGALATGSLVCTHSVTLHILLLECSRGLG